MKPGTISIVAYLDLRPRKLPKLLHCLHIRSTHVGGRDHPELSTSRRKCPKLIDNQTQAAPLDEGNQHIDPIARNDLLLKLGIHLWLMYRTSEKTRLRDRCLRSCNRFFRPIVYGPDRVLLIKKGQKLLGIIHYREPISVIIHLIRRCCINNAIDHFYLIGNISAGISYSFELFFYCIRNIVRQHPRCLRLIDRLNLTYLVILMNGKLLAQLMIDYLFIKPIVKHGVLLENITLYI